MLPHYSYSYSLPYLAFFLYIYILQFQEYKCINRKIPKQKIEHITYVSFLIFVGLRGLVYTDWATYYPFFEKLPTIYEWNDWTLQKIVENCGFEKGFIFYSIIIKSIFPNFFFWTFIGTFIDLIIIHILFKENIKYYTLGFIIFFIFGGLGIEFNLFRNSKGIMCFLLSLKYIKERKIIPYTALIIMGCYFHISSLIYLPLYFVLNRNLNIKLIWIIFLVGNIIYLLQIPYMSKLIILIASYIGGRIHSLVEFYFNSPEHSQNFGITIGYIERTCSFILFMVLYAKNRNCFSVIYSNMFIIYIFLFLFCSEISILVSRIPLLFIFSYAIIFPQIFACLKSLKFKKIFLIFFLIYASLKIVALNDEIFSRYDNVLFGVESYEKRIMIFNQYIDKSK